MDALVAIYWLNVGVKLAVSAFGFLLQTSADRYPEGMRHEDPTTSFVRDLRFNFHPQYKQKKTNLWNRLKPKLQAEDPVIR